MAAYRNCLPASVPSKGQLVGFLAHGLRHITCIAVAPDESPILQIDPFPFERNNFGATKQRTRVTVASQQDDVVKWVYFPVGSIGM